MNLPILSGVPNLTLAMNEPNAGGVRRLRLVMAQHLQVMLPQRFPQPSKSGYDAHTISGQHLTFTPSASLVDVDVMPDYCSFIDDMDDTPAGLLYRPTIKIIIPKIRPDVVAWVQQYAPVRWVAFLEDRNGFFRMAGLPHEPLTMAATFGQDMGKGKNQTVLTFAGEAQRPAFFLTGIANADLQYAGPFDTAFGFGFDS